MPSGFHRAADAGVELFGRVGRADDLADLGAEKFRNGTNSDQAFSHNRTIAGYGQSQVSTDSRNRSIAAASIAAV